MKKFKYLLLLIIVVLCGCESETKVENMDIYTTAYPIEYVTNRIYGEHSTITSIYPDNVDKDYVVSDKLLKDYSKTDLFIFNSNDENENKYVIKMFNNNKNLKIIDASSSLSYNYATEELWLDPINLLTIANNIKKGFNEYVTIAYLQSEIDVNYKALKNDLIKLDADYREMANRANKKTIVVGNDLYLYLTKYGINVISLEQSENYTKKNYYDAEDLIKSGDIKYIYVIKGSSLNKEITELKEKYNITIVELDSLLTLTEDERKEKKDYLDIMHNNLELLKEELYN
jgi:zinc transport system substrate-binding protein